jgi:hypothetical protein
MIQDRDPPWEKEPAEPRDYEGDFPPGSEPDECGTKGGDPPDASDPPRPDRIDDGMTCPD